MSEVGAPSLERPLAPQREPVTWLWFLMVTGCKDMATSPRETKQGENRAESRGMSSRKTNGIQSWALRPQSTWEAVSFLLSLLTTRCLAWDGVALLVITSCSDREVIDHLRGSSLIEKVSIDRDKSFFSWKPGFLSPVCLCLDQPANEAPPGRALWILSSSCLTGLSPEGRGASTCLMAGQGRHLSVRRIHSPNRGVNALNEPVNNCRPKLFSVYPRWLQGWSGDILGH